MTHPEIRGERTVLRAVSASDLDQLTKWFADPGVPLVGWLPEAA